MVAAEARVEEAGNAEYTATHMSAIFREGFSFSGYERDYLAWSQGGRKLLDISGVSGLDAIGDGRGAAFADFDNDGDMDIFLVSLQGNAHELFRNEVGSDAGFLRIHVQGSASGPDAFGAIVRVGTPHGVLTKVKAGGAGFLAQHDPRLLFGLGDAAGADWIEVTWPGGGKQRFEATTPAGFAARTSVRVVEGAGIERVAESRFALVDPLGNEARALAGLELGIGDTFPDLELVPRADIREGVGLPGAPAVRLHELLQPGRRLLVNLWATWCIPCRREMPELQALAPAFANQGIDLVGLSIDTDTIDRVAPFVRQIGASYPIHVTRDGRVADLFARDEITVPLSVLLDDQGRVRQVLGGWSAETAGAFRALARIVP